MRRPRRAKANPIPPFVEWARPRTLPTVAPVPAPTLPSAGGAGDAATLAAYPIASSGRSRASPTPRSYRMADGTIGTGPAEVGNPTPRSSR
jgi:hypothetical protein